MVQPLLAEQVAMVERHILQGEINVSAQRHRVHALEASGKEAGFSRALLVTFQQSLAMHYGHRAALLREIAE